MAEVTNELIYETLKALQAQGAAFRDDMADLKLRLGHLETTVAQINVRMAEMSVRIDRIEVRLDRIERRLELADA